MIDFHNQLRIFQFKHLEMFRDFLNEEIARRGGSIGHRPTAAPSRAEFKVGDRASFIDKNGNMRIIVINRMNRQTISGIEHNDVKGVIKWRVSPNLLTLVEE